MGLFYSVSDKQMLRDINKILKETSLKTLEVNGFIPRPFGIDSFGEYDRDIQGYMYSFGRISKGGHLEYIRAFCIRATRCIQIEVSIICSYPEFKSIYDLNSVDKYKFIMSLGFSNSMQIRADEYILVPWYCRLFVPQHKLGTYWTKSGYEYEIEKLKNKVLRDLENIDSFIEKWHRLHKLKVLDWDGNELS